MRTKKSYLHFIYVELTLFLQITSTKKEQMSDDIPVVLKLDQWHVGSEWKILKSSVLDRFQQSRIFFMKFTRDVSICIHD